MSSNNLSRRQKRRFILFSFLKPVWMNIKTARQIRDKLGENFVFSKEDFNSLYKNPQQYSTDTYTQQWLYFATIIAIILGIILWIVTVYFIYKWSTPTNNPKISVLATILAVIFLFVPPGPILSWIIILISFFRRNKFVQIT